MALELGNVGSFMALDIPQTAPRIRDPKMSLSKPLSIQMGGKETQRGQETCQGQTAVRKQQSWVLNQSRGLSQSLFTAPPGWSCEWGGWMLCQATADYGKKEAYPG